MDEKGIEFHIAVGDYFGTLATVLSLWAQDLNRGMTDPKAVAEGLFKKSAELSHLQEHYRIAKLGPQQLENVNRSATPY